MKRFLEISALLIAALAVLSGGCASDEIFTADSGEPFYVTAKNENDFLRLMLAALRGGKWYQSCLVNGSEGTIAFNDGSRITFKAKDLTLVTGEPKLSLEDGYWRMDGKKLPIAASDESVLDNCKIVCASRGGGQMTLYLNNGKKVHFVSRGADLLDNVKLEKAMNPSIQGDIIFSKSGRDFSASSIYYFNPSSLKLSYELYGKAVFSGGKGVVRGSELDLTETVVLTVEAYDGSRFDFTVSLSVPEDGTRPRRGMMPTVFISTENGARINSKDVYINGTIRLQDVDKWYSDVTSVSLPMKIRGRGQTSWSMPKKPYRIKLDEESKVFGMPSNKDWDLLANYSDKTLLRNSLGFYLSAIMGMAWTPLYQAVDVYLNGNYNGSYIIVQHKEVARKKVNINPIPPDALSGEALEGDYYVEVEGSEFDFSSPRCYNTEIYGIPFQFKDPEIPEPEQREYFKNQVRAFEQRLRDGKYTCEDSYNEYIDVDSFVDNYIIQEISKNIDGNMRKSTFLTKEKGRKLRIYHVWDFDIAFGNCNYMHTEFNGSNGIYGHDPRTWFIKDIGHLGKGKGWYPNLFKDPEFVAAVKKRWKEVYPQLQKAPDFLDTEAAVNRSSYDNNFNKWKILGTYVWPNPVAPATYDGELQVLKDFYTQRIEWMDSEISKW